MEIKDNKAFFTPSEENETGLPNPLPINEKCVNMLMSTIERERHLNGLMAEDNLLHAERAALPYDLIRIAERKRILTLIVEHAMMLSFEEAKL